MPGRNNDCCGLRTVETTTRLSPEDFDRSTPSSGLAHSLANGAVTHAPQQISMGMQPSRAHCTIAQNGENKDPLDAQRTVRLPLRAVVASSSATRSLQSWSISFTATPKLRRRPTSRSYNARSTNGRALVLPLEDSPSRTGSRVTIRAITIAAEG